jgi:carbon monoxide dehydrogenase subunit G
MAILSERVETPLAIDEAFAFVGDFANAMHWDPGVATSERIDRGPVGVGARYRLGVRTRGRVAQMEYVVTAYDASKQVVLEGTGAGVDATDDIRFSPTADGGTRIDYTADIRLRGWMRLLSPLAGRAFQRIAHDARNGMQRALDARASAERGAA